MGTLNAFKTDEKGRTALFDAAEKGDVEAVEQMLYRLTGTGLGCQRLALIEMHDLTGLTAIDVAEQQGHNDIVDLLRREKERMEFFE